MAIESWMPTLTTNLGAITGLAGGCSDYFNLPAGIDEFPKMIVLPESGFGFYGQGQGAVDVHRLKVLLLQPSQLLSEAATVLVPFIALVQAKVAANLTLGNRVDHCLLATEGNWYEGPNWIEWAKKEYLGIVFRLEVKERSNVTVSP
jgi:hypothetical protein